MEDDDEGMGRDGKVNEKVVWRGGRLQTRLLLLDGRGEGEVINYL